MELAEEVKEHLLHGMPLRIVELPSPFQAHSEPELRAMAHRVVTDVVAALLSSQARPGARGATAEN
jgi:hypothetical protein